MLVRVTIFLAIAGAACAIGAASAVGAATISGGDDDVWNAAGPPTYTITGSAPGVEITWSFRGGDSDEPDDLNNTGQSPFTVTLPGLSDAAGYRLVAKETGDHEPDKTRRRFAVDTTPPRVEIDTPAPGAVYAQGQQVAAGYRCDEGACAGTVPDGGLVPTATPGPQSFLVTATDPAGNTVTVRRDYAVDAPAPMTLEPAPLVPVRPKVVAPESAGKLPTPDNAKGMRPRLGAEVRSTQPLLRWRKVTDATLYNVQVFRFTGKRLVKVLSIFPVRNYVRVPAGRLTPGAIHVWRVWPMVDGHYTPKPLGISNFDVKKEGERRPAEADRPIAKSPSSVQVFMNL
jgi:hypothetical protein